MADGASHFNCLSVEAIMNETTKGSLSAGVKVLTESDIQTRLYGRYLKEQLEECAQAPAQSYHAVSPQISSEVVSQKEWDGTEILSGELKRLRDELILLRQEREWLEQQLKRSGQVSLTRGEAASFRAAAQRPGRLWGFLGKFVAGFALVSGVVYPLGVQLLQASPSMMMESSPYTIQVAVYDVKPIADQAFLYLQELGYSAFMVEAPRRDGRERYRLYVGQFVTKEEANLEKMKLAADPKFSDAFVRFR